LPFHNGTIRCATCLAQLAASVWLASATFTQAQSSLDLSKAAKQFKRSCGTCHAVEPGATQRQGPNLATVVGRTAGSLSEFQKYSDALKAAGVGGLVWTPETLDPWIMNAGKYVPKTNMSSRQRSAEKRALVIAYLKSLATKQDTNQ